MADPLTVDDIKDLEFGYLTGADLLRFCPQQYLIKQEMAMEGFLQEQVETAYQEMKSELSTKCDLATEYEKSGSEAPNDRDKMVVKMTALCSIRNIIANATNIPEQMVNNLNWLDKTLDDIRKGLRSLADIAKVDDAIASESVLIDQSFLTLG